MVMAILPRVAPLPRTDDTKSLPLGVSPLTSFEYSKVYDEISCNAPLDAFDADKNAAVYPEFQPGERSATPQPPPGFGDEEYLYPHLTRNEYVRLSLLWYHARDLYEDEQLLQNLQLKTDLLRSIVGWEFAIIGILDAHAYRKVVTSNLDVAVLPRRESLCSHTIQGNKAGSVLAISNLAEDWRFKNSPHVAQGGLQSYAGSPIICRTASGEAAAIGSFCVASSTPGRVLTKVQRDTLVGFADMVSSELISRSLFRRREHQQRMTDLLAQAIGKSDVDEEGMLRLLRKGYPQANVLVCDVRDGTLAVSTDPPRDLPIASIRNGLWEDRDMIESRIIQHNHNPPNSGDMVRALVSSFWGQPHTKALVVATSDMYYVFDEIDAWFVERCSGLLSSLAHRRMLDEARLAKDKFLRGITHQLRTPIHGVLGSLELLSEELEQRTGHDALAANNTSLPTGNKVKDQAMQLGLDGALSTGAYIRAIRRSGRELLSTVNNMIALSRWESMVGSAPYSALTDLSSLEESILEEAVKHVSEPDLDRICILFHNKLPPNTSCSMLNLDMLVHAVSLLLANALQFTARGCVVISVHAAADCEAIIFDVEDTGKGIRKENAARIFEPFEKEDEHSRGAGLGLTIASRLANAMLGNVTLVSSTSKGSHFRATFGRPGLGCLINQPTQNGHGYGATPTKYRLIPAAVEPLVLRPLQEFLSARGIERTMLEEECDFLVVSYSRDAQEFASLLDTARKMARPTVCLLPTGGDVQTLGRDHAHVNFANGPFTTAKLNEIIRRIEDQIEVQRKSNACSTIASHRHRTGEATIASDRTGLDGTQQVSLALRVRNKPPRVLLVDDNAINLRIVQLYCTKRALASRSALDGFEAIAEYRSALAAGDPLRLILLDLQMPRCDGIQACETIRAIEREHGAPPSVIFILTGQDGSRDKERATLAGADQYYVKPVSLKMLDRAIGAYFELPAK